MIAAALALLLLGGRFQDDADARPHTIPKQERSTYVPAVQKYRDAEAALADPLECVKRCTELLEDKSVRETHRDSLMRIQNTDGSYGDWFLFAPFQLRGRAHLARAEALAPRDRREAAEQVQLAVADFDESFRRGVKSSEPFLARARKLSLQLKEAGTVPNDRLAEAERRLVEIRKLRDQKAPPAIVLDRCEAAAEAVKGSAYEGEWGLIRDTSFAAHWSGLADAGRFRAARAAVAKCGGFLAAAGRKDVIEKIDERSRQAALRFHADLRELLPDQDTWAAFVRVPSSEIERRLSLPEAGELDGVDGGLLWARRCREMLLPVRAAADLPAAPAEAFLRSLGVAADLCVEAAAQVPDGENRAFAALEALVLDLAVGRLERNVSGAFAEEPEGLGRRRDESRRVVEAFEKFAARFEKDPPPAVTKHLAQIRAMPDRLPIDPVRIDEIGRRLLDPSDPKGLWGRTPDLALDYETELEQLNRFQGERFSRSSRRRLATCLLVSKVARLLLSGARAEDLARREELKTLSQKLESDGGPLPDVLKAVSPRVRAVLDRLRS